MNTKRKTPVKIYNDGFNEIIFKPNTNKVVIGLNIHSWSGSRYKSFKAKTIEDAEKKGIKYINKKSRVLWQKNSQKSNS